MLAMSNGEDVLDNWEEIDEATLTNNLQKLEDERKLRKNTKVEQLNTFPETVTSTVDSTTNFATSIVPGTMKLLQRPAQKSLVAQQQLNIADEASSAFDNIQSTFQPVLMVLHKDSDEYQSANYTQPINSQTVKILRRPTQSSEPRNNGVRPKQPIKTLQQREQEYAEARLRILGAAKNPEDDQAANANNTPTPLSITTEAATSTTNAPITTTVTVNDAQAKINVPNKSPQQQPKQPQQQTQPQQHYGGALNPYNPFYQQQNFYYQNQPQPPLHHSLSSPSFGVNNRSQFMSAGLLPTPPIVPNAASANMRHQFQQQQQHQQQEQQTWSPVVGGSVSSYTLQRQQQQRQQQQHLDVLRTPRGPDGSNGFQMRR